MRAPIALALSLRLNPVTTLSSSSLPFAFFCWYINIFFVVIRCWLVHITIDTYMVYTLHIYVLECETKGIHQSKWMCLHLRINEFNYKLTHELHCHLSIAHCFYDLWQVQVDWLWYVTMSFLRHLHQLTCDVDGGIFDHRYPYLYMQ